MANTREQISLLQQAIWKLEAARDLLDEACETVDPNSRAISQIITAVQNDLDEISG